MIAWTRALNLVNAALVGGVMSLGSAAALAADGKHAHIGVIELEGAIKDRSPQKDGGLFSMGGNTADGLRDIVGALRKAAADDNLGGVLIQLRDAELSRTHIEELGAAMKSLRAAGKRVHVFSENYGPAELALGSFADEVLVQSGGGVTLPGMYMEEMFLADALKWIGVTPDFVQIGDYKGAEEMYANSKPSKAWNENIDALLDSLYGTMRAELKAGRKMNDAQLDEAMKTLWMGSDTDAVKTGVVDASIDLLALEDHLKKAYGKDIEWNSDLLPSHDSDVDASNPFAMMASLMKKPDYSPKRQTIGVLHIDGQIIDGDSTDGGLFGGSQSVGSRTIRRTLKELEDNDLIKGVIVRIDSPGGSAIASEVIWQGVRRVAAKKPVWVSIGSMAASGGYYIAVAGDKIYLNPSSIVGSIGVVGGKLALSGVMDKVHVNVVGRARGPRAGMMSSMSPWTEEQRGLVRAKMKETYDLFTKRVTSGREGIELGKTAEGRLFIGQKAIDLRMADKIGTLPEAIDDLAAKLSMSQDSYDVMDFPAPKSLQEVLQDALGGFSAKAPGVSGAAALGQVDALGQVTFGQSWGQVRTHLSALMQLRSEPVLLISPSVLIVR